MKKTLSISQALDLAWDQTKKNFGIILSFFVAYFIAAIVLTFIPMYFPKDIMWIPEAIALVIRMVIAFVFAVGLTKMGLVLVDKERMSFSDFFAEAKTYGKYFTTSLLTGLTFLAIVIIPAAIIIGSYILATHNGDTATTGYGIAITIVTILVGIVAAIGIIYTLLRLGTAWSQFPYLIIDKDAGIIESLKASSQIMQGAKIKYLLIVESVVMGIVICGILALYFGVLLAIPVVMIIRAFIYRELLAQSDLKT